MNLNLIHRIFGKARGLDRSDIETYGKTTNSATRQAIEEGVANDPFDADALEGWEGLNYNITAMQALDRKFSPSAGKSWFLRGGLAAIAAASILTYSLWPGNPSPANNNVLISETVQEDDREILLDESDVLLPEQIEAMENAPKHEQLTPEVIKQDFVDIEEIRRKDPPVVVAELPKLELSTDKPHDVKIIRKHELAKEIYLHDFKLIDYRNYRSKPTVKIRQLVLSGLPANYEDTAYDEFEPNWKEVDIPYIEYIDKSMRVFGQGNYKRALSRFETILSTYAFDVNAHFYSGLCLFNLGEYDQALSHFTACIDGPYSNFDEESDWMVASCYEQMGMRAKAKAIYERIVKEGGYYAQQAAKKIQ